jgi:hypothetical protein
MYESNEKEMSDITAIYIDYLYILIINHITDINILYILFLHQIHP